jgi:hypothetical protein
MLTYFLVKHLVSSKLLLTSSLSIDGYQPYVLSLYPHRLLTC